jgi:hypothetical protein
MCCGYTMTLISTTANVEKAVGETIDSQIPHSRDFIEEQEDDLRRSHRKSDRYGGKYKGRGKEKRREA